MAEPGASPDVVWHPSAVSAAQRRGCVAGLGVTVWFTGLSGAGKSTVAAAVEEALVAAGRLAYLLDGDNIRHGLNGDLAFSRRDRDENVRRVGEVARLFADAGVIALVPLISPYREGRERVRAAHEAAGIAFLEVFVDTPLAECERRDVKGLYARARSGELVGFTGVDDPYEPPTNPELRLRPDDGGATTQAQRVVALLADRGLL